MFVARAAVDIARPVEQVWPVVVDRRRDPEWRGECVAMELLEGEATEPGAVFREVIRVGPREVEAVLHLEEVEPPRRVVFSGTEPAWLPSTNTLTLTPTDGGCRVSFASRAEVRGPWSFTEPVFRWLFQRSLDRELANLRDHLEAVP